MDARPTLASLLTDAQLTRGVTAALIAGALIALCMRSPRAAAIATLLFLPFLALLRRLLILVGGWASLDPLLVVAPLVAAFLLARLFVVERRRLAPERLSLLVLGLLALAVAHSLHPFGFGLEANLVGFMFLGLPLVWFFVGRELADVQGLRTLLYAVLGTAAAVALYGFLQIEAGFPEWDDRWIDVNGYNALYITEETIRPFGTFSSSAEYGAFMSVGLVVALAFGMRLRRALLLAVPLLVMMIYLNSSRGMLIIALTVSTVVLILHTRGHWVRMAASLAAFGAVAGGVILLLNAAYPGAALTEHQVQGLQDPGASTLPLHLEIIEEGFEEAIRRPLGQGTASTTIAATTVADARESKTSEFDLLDLFISLGFVGMLVGAAIMAIVLRRTAGFYLARPGPETLACLGLVLVTFGSWFNGGFYAVAPLVWFTVGWVSRRWTELRPPEPPAPLAA